MEREKFHFSHNDQSEIECVRVCSFVFTEY